MVLFTILSEHFPVLYPVARTLDALLFFAIVNIILYKNAKRLRLKAFADSQIRFLARFARFKFLIPFIFGLSTLLLYLTDCYLERIRLEEDLQSPPTPNTWLWNFQLTWYFAYIPLRRAGYRISCALVAAVGLAVEVMVIRPTCFPERFPPAYAREGVALPDSRDCFEQAYPVIFTLLGLCAIELSEWQKRRQPVVDAEKSDAGLEKQPVEQVEDVEIEESEKAETGLS
ncbi:hypothetical protein BDV97DRAFT_398435 [Delphinella strobiligena]|nr:hypothetical protein BDV97DRAFT_398435 [Delphinella strobiligena]